jgi:hypothetical protein
MLTRPTWRPCEQALSKLFGNWAARAYSREYKAMARQPRPAIITTVITSMTMISLTQISPTMGLVFCRYLPAADWQNSTA